MTAERAMEILDPNHREHYESIKIVNEACRMGIQALKIIYPTAGKDPDYEPSNAEVLIQVLSDVVWANVDEDGFPEVPYEDLVMLTQNIRCPHIHNPRCALDERTKNSADAFRDCDACKAHWLMEKWEG